MNNLLESNRNFFFFFKSLQAHKVDKLQIYVQQTILKIQCTKENKNSTWKQSHMIRRICHPRLSQPCGG